MASLDSPRGPPRRAQTHPVRFAAEPDIMIRRGREPPRPYLDEDVSSRNHDQVREVPENTDQTTKVFEKETISIAGYPSPPTFSPGRCSSIDSGERSYRSRKKRIRRLGSSFHRYPSRYRGYNWRDSDSNSESDWSDDAYDFQLSSHSKGPVSDDSEPGSATALSEKGSNLSDSQLQVRSCQIAKSLSVLRSQYTGDRSVGGLQTAQLTTIHDLNHASRKSLPPIFRWM